MRLEGLPNYFVNETEGCEILFEGKEGNRGAGFSESLLAFLFVLNACFLSAIWTHIWSFAVGNTVGKVPRYILHSFERPIDCYIRCQALGQVQQIQR